MQQNWNKKSVEADFTVIQDHNVTYAPSIYFHHEVTKSHLALQISANHSVIAYLCTDISGFQN